MFFLLYTDVMSNNLIIVDHPLVQHKLGILRDQTTPTVLYRMVTKEITVLLAYRLLETLPLVDKPIKTPMEGMTAKSLPAYDPAIVSILRAGNGFLDGLVDMLPNAKIGFIGLARNAETHEAEFYYEKLPDDLGKRPVFLVDPMLATGGSAIDAVNRLKSKGATDIRFLTLIAAPEGLAAFHAVHPDVVVVTASLDRQLNDTKYIMPGLGDAGDRYYGTN